MNASGLEFDFEHGEPLAGDQLAAFVTAADIGNIGRAADALSLTQSATTKRIQKLEARLGKRLLERWAGGVRPTEAGRALYPAARAALRALGRAAHSLEADLAASGGPLRLAASPTAADVVLPKLLTGFREVAPDLRLRVDVANTGGVIHALGENTVEIGLVANAQRTPDFSSITLVDDELMVVVSAAHRWAKADRVDPAELESAPFFTREEGSDTRSLATAAARDLGIELVPAVEAASMRVLKRLVQAGHGFTIISSLATDAELQAGTLRALHLTGADLRRPIRALRRAEEPTGTVERFWEWLEATAQNLAQPPTTARLRGRDH